MYFFRGMVAGRFRLAGYEVMDENYDFPLIPPYPFYYSLFVAVYFFTGQHRLSRTVLSVSPICSDPTFIQGYMIFRRLFCGCMHRYSEETAMKTTNFLSFLCIFFIHLEPILDTIISIVTKKVTICTKFCVLQTY